LRHRVLQCVAEFYMAVMAVYYIPRQSPLFWTLSLTYYQNVAEAAGSACVFRRGKRISQVGTFERPVISDPWPKKA